MRGTRVSPTACGIAALLLGAVALPACQGAPVLECPMALPDWDFDGGGATEPEPGSAASGGGRVDVSVESAVGKVKDLLTGLPATDAEVDAVDADPSALAGLVEQWIATAEYRAKMLGFFTTAFQQDQFDYRDMENTVSGHLPFRTDEELRPLFVQNVQQSFGRTALALIDEGRPFTEVMTTRRFMVTPVLAAFLAISDYARVSDTFVMTDQFQKQHAVQVTLQSSKSTPWEDSFDPSNAQFLVFYEPGIAQPWGDGCPTGQAVYPAPAPFDAIASQLFERRRAPIGPMACVVQHSADDRRVTPEDFSTWRMVTLREPQRGEDTTQLYELGKLRHGDVLVFNVPRVSFFSTPAFAARWPTNNSNLARVLANQTAIVGLGRNIDASNPTEPDSVEAVDPVHAPVGSECYACHKSLDPMRQFFRQTYSLYFGVQEDPAQQRMPGRFAFFGVSTTGASIVDLGAAIASHPLFATAWVQKLCTWATSAPCDEEEPEFKRIVSVFQSRYSWNDLVKALFSSRIVTGLGASNAMNTLSPEFAIARQAHLCATLSVRLGIPDVCGLDVTKPATSQVAQLVAAAWPSDGYSRGAPEPALARDPTLLLRGGMENLCADLADRLIDKDNDATFPVRDPKVAIHAMATRLMGLTRDRAAGPQAALQCHYGAAVSEGADARDALKSTFVLACLSPYVVGIGL